ncbi:hypothetical protein GLOIN_2v1780499 [Rhizophagus irregularis DAOM 181602=DAOM 197198]|uniref:Uncharacterized protein n=2 Tax=Rhizophagus irregularis TaxID=588596 RepID=A0A2P4PM69_RHIID|nr:hypothetical protein GLOIN_2v1780499 [Rhizophagus irregularis DAOM 181602=DAOM 197198]POG66457.1 hypothetical protein GLOIN_2v1780499 [Rhizophagus irregularis DAOM 181602=DAOM 197198]|eukprot:XP_025173323.1 hypothetical protein GLOIN_2v1780499 [Rhizophagus irregularis DAOM 181602=DAOM 197198]
MSIVRKCVKDHLWSATLNCVENSKTWCPWFAVEKRPGLSTEYVNSTIPMLWRCGKGHEWATTLYRIKNMGRCHNNILADFLKIHSQGLELDIYYLQYGFAIELVRIISFDMAVYLENACKYVGADNLHREKAIMDVLKLHIFHNQRYSQAIKPLQYSIVPYESQEYFTPSHYNETFSEEIKINPSFESYLVSDIEDFFQRRGKSLVDVFVDNIILLNINSSEMWA